jgi:hypothetical protein
MNKRILPALAVALALFSANSFAQTNRAFAITSETRGSYNWSSVKEVDLSTGEVIKTHYERAMDKNLEIFNTNNDRVFLGNKSAATVKATPMAEGVAAAAYDSRQKRLYYTCMRGTELRYFDLGSSSTRVVYNQAKSLFDGNRYDEANVITRMAFGSDGFGYALTNDGNHLVRFTTDKRATITDLGPLIDGKKNGTVSIHAQCSSWGGDMVGDAYGNLYVVTYKNYLFKVNPQTRTADLVGQIKGLPAQFTSNGMVVDDNGELVVSSAMVADNYYRVNVSTLDATSIKKGQGEVFNASDLANSNLLFQNNAAPVSKILSEVKGNDAVSIYPNPVTTKTFTVQFDRLPAGRYNLALTDASGRNVIARSLVIGAAGQVEKVNLPKTAAGGMYLLKITGNSRELVYSDKIVVQ